MDDGMNISAESISAMKQAQIGDAVAIKVLKLTNDSQKSVLSLIDGATQTAARVQEAGKGANIDIDA